MVKFCDSLRIVLKNIIIFSEKNVSRNNFFGGGGGG